jgi:DNA-binding CsgD family transcriptional regulator
MRGRFDEAQAELDRVARGDEHTARRVSYRRAELAFWRGDHATAIPIFERRREREVAAGIRHPNVVTWMSDLLDSLAAVARRDEAVDLAREHVALARRTGGVIGLGTFQLALGRLTGDLDALERALEILAASPYRWHRARAELDFGVALRRARERVRARQHLRAALDYAEREGARHFADRAREELRLAGARPRRALLTGVESLTPAEARIARMAAGGRSNKEIAQALFLTVKTVEMNLVRAYRKLDISSRRELPGALAQG